MLLEDALAVLRVQQWPPERPIHSVTVLDGKLLAVGRSRVTSISLPVGCT
ncbi:hypothetical protein [Actinoplanes solisilvae]|nr:hypothetical protein [Actinoplanes solisilvae]